MPKDGALEIDPKRAGDDKRTRIPRANAIPSPAETIDQYGEYTVIKSINVGVLQAFTQIGKLIIPRFIFYAVFFTTLLFGYTIIFHSALNAFALSFGIFACAFSWYETMRTWKRRPF